jgi:DNA-binding HxlR family transcriptional regulator
MATQTAAQRRRAEALAYREFVRTCPTARLLRRLGDKWVTLLLVALSDGARRYGELSREVPGASQKMLTQSLRALERDGLVARSVTPTVPVRVDYELTALGASLLPVLRAVKDWAELHMTEVGAAQADHDVAEVAKPAGPPAGADRVGAARECAVPAADDRAGRLARVG